MRKLLGGAMLGVAVLAASACSGSDEINCNPLPAGEIDGCLGSPDQVDAPGSSPRYPSGCTAKHDGDDWSCVENQSTGGPTAFIWVQN